MRYNSVADIVDLSSFV